MTTNLIPDEQEAGARSLILQIVQQYGANAMPKLVEAVGSADLLRLWLAELWPDLFANPKPDTEPVVLTGRIARTYKIGARITQAGGSALLNVLDSLGKVSVSGELTIVADAAVWNSGVGDVVLSGRLIAADRLPVAVAPEKIANVRFHDFQARMVHGIVCLDTQIEKAGVRVQAWIAPLLESHSVSARAVLHSSGDGIASLIADSLELEGDGTLTDERNAEEAHVDAVTVGTGRPIFSGALTYAWPAAVQAGTIAAELEAVAKSAAAAWAVGGVTLEVQGLGARPASNSSDWKREYAQLCEWMPEVVRAALNRNLRVNLYVFNTNTPGKGWKGSWNAADVAGNRKAIAAVVDPMLAALPADDRLLVCPHNETDDNTHPSIMADLVAMCRQRIPADRLISTAQPEAWAKWHDIHPQKLASPKPCGARTIITSDSGIIGELMEGGGWGTTPKPIVSACDRFGEAHAAAGMLAFYTVGSVPTAVQFAKEWADVFKACHDAAVSGGTGTGTVTGPQDAVAFAAFQSLGKHHMDITRVPITRKLISASNRGDTVALSFEPLRWSTETGKNGKTVDGGVCIGWMDGDTLKGGHFDWHGVNQTVKTQNNIPGGYLNGQKPPDGAPVFYWLINREHDQRTNIVAGGTWNT